MDLIAVGLIIAFPIIPQLLPMLMLMG